MSTVLRSITRWMTRSALLLAALTLGGCEQGRMLREADAQLAGGNYEQALATYQDVRKQTPIQQYRVRADKGIAAASQALVGGVQEASREASQSGLHGRALLQEARAAQLAGNKAYASRQSEHARALLDQAALVIQIQAMDSGSSPVLGMLSDRLTSTALLRATTGAEPANGGVLRIGVEERPLLTDRQPKLKTVNYVDKQVPGPNPAYAAQQKRRDQAARQAQAADKAFHHQQTLQFSAEARANRGDNVRNSQRSYAWIEAERLRKVAAAAKSKLAAEERKLSQTPPTIDVPHYEKFTFDAMEYTQDLTGEMKLSYLPPEGGAEQIFGTPLRISVRDDAYAAQPKVDLLAKGPNLPALEEMRYTFQQKAVTEALAWLNQLDSQRREAIEANAKGAAGPLDPAEAAIAFMISANGPIPKAQVAELDAQIERGTGIAGASALLGVDARSPSIVDIHPGKSPEANAPEPAE